MPSVYIIPDIHGYDWEFNALLDKIGLNKNDKLFLLGDYIDRGPNSKHVVDKIIELIEQGYNLTPLRGNHEQMLLDSSRELTTFYSMSNKRKLPFCDSQKKIKSEYIDFFSSLPFYIKTPDLLLAHAGINFRKPEPLEDTHSVLWMRCMRYMPDDISQTVIHGHTPMPYSEIVGNIESGARVIPLDNGVFMKNQKDYGNLLCLDWSRKQIYSVKKQ